MNNQQYAIRAVEFKDVKTGIQIDHVFTLSLQGLNFQNCDVGVNYTAAPKSSVGSLVLIDSKASSTKQLILSQHTKNADGSIIIENVKLNDVGVAVSDRNGTVVLPGTSHSSTIKSYIQGTVYKDATTGSYMEASGTYSRSQVLLDHSGDYWTKSRPQYERYSSSCFASVKDFGARGDGKTDDTKAIIAALKANVNRRITYFPAGNYRVSDTVLVPAGSRLVGEAWSTLSGTANSSPKHKVRFIF